MSKAGRATLPARFRPSLAGGLGRGWKQLRLRCAAAYWATGLYSLRLRGRFPLKLKALPGDAVGGDAHMAAQFLGSKLRVAAQELEWPELDFAALEQGRPLTRYLQSFAFLRDLAGAGSQGITKAIAEEVTRKWLYTYANTRSLAAWHPDLWGWRIIYWCAHARILLYSLDLVYRSQALNTLARGARHLRHSVKHTSAGVDRLAAYVALLTSNLLIEGDETQQHKDEARLEKALASVLNAEGGVHSRNPKEQAECVALLAQLRNVYAARKLAFPLPFQHMLAQAHSQLEALRLGDGRLSSWQGESQSLAPVVAQGEAAPHFDTAQAVEAVRTALGYTKVQAGTLKLVMDSDAPVHAQGQPLSASSLAFELSDGATRFIINCGGAGLYSALLPPDISAALLSSDAHSTLILGEESSSQHGARPCAVAVRLSEEAQEWGVAAVHDGYMARYGLQHGRVLKIRKDGNGLRGEDSLRAKRTKVQGAIPFVVRFHLGVDVVVEYAEDIHLGEIGLRLPDNRLWHFQVTGGQLALEESICLDTYGEPHPIKQIVISGLCQEAALVQWRFTRVGAEG
jgi:uncharacterized heparinase superfamily protein